jgi:hypothetical protein
MMRRTGARSSRNRAGLSLVEALITLSITASLLTAVGVAYQGAANIIQTNDQFFRASQAARVSVNQIIAEVRKCQGGAVSATSLELTTADGMKRTYALDADAHTLTRTDFIGATPVTTRMASNVGSLQFDTDGDTISMTITVQVESSAVTLNGSAIPRRLVVYK